MPAPPCRQKDSLSKVLDMDRCIRELHWDGWTALPDPCISQLRAWDLSRFVERLHRRYSARILNLLEKWHDNWMEADDEGDAPGAARPGGLVARRVTESLKGAGVFVYAAHPSQADDAEDDEYSGPRWYVTCTEAVMNHYEAVGVAPPPPSQLQAILWPCEEDRQQPWLTEIGWTIVPENSDPQVMHADICYPDGPNPRRPGRGRYHHFVWKLDPVQNCTTNVVPGAFTEGIADWDHYDADKWTIAKAPALIFDSEMLHRGGRTLPGTGWTSTLTLQVCSGAGWLPLSERVGAGMMEYTQPMGWACGDAVDAFVDGTWRPGFVESRNKDSGSSLISFEGASPASGTVKDSNLRWRQAPINTCATKKTKLIPVGSAVEAQFEGEWYKARVARHNADGSYRVVWGRVDGSGRSFSDGIPAQHVRKRAHGWQSGSGSEASSEPRKKRAGAPTPAVRGDAKRRRVEQDEVGGKEGTVSEVTEMRTTLLRRGVVELDAGLPESWRKWEIFAFAENYHDRFSALVARELESLRDFWEPCEGSSQRHGAFAASLVSERLKQFGVAVYSPGSSQSQSSPYQQTGPRWYVSITAAAFEHYGAAAPGPPPELRELLCGHAKDADGTLRARGLGWTLAPRGADPQALHADIWGYSEHARSDRTRWPHFLWKRKEGELCTTEIVPEGFTEGSVGDADFQRIMRVRAAAIVVDSEVLHRGAATPPSTAGAAGSDEWVSSLSLELCSPSGWEAWEAYRTGGTTKDPSSPLDWRMLCFARPGEESASRPLPAAATPQLAPASWETPEGRTRLRQQQKEWELS
eukprot:TRINITY_DN72876_c0_g1_i1.p1 TRINITY_DN72876_c0_g1~~TRINITY_DN72876_c0_g1_i1.p1  ORF type:complete len:807 (-),score=161.93 TRINITY_DN72876_c0_g1_i1:78-2498(-)